MLPRDGCAAALQLTSNELTSTQVMNRLSGSFSPFGHAVHGYAIKQLKCKGQGLAVHDHNKFGTGQDNMAVGSNFVVPGLQHHIQDHTPNFIARISFTKNPIERVASMVASLYQFESCQTANRSTLEEGSINSSGAIAPWPTLFLRPWIIKL